MATPWETARRQRSTCSRHGSWRARTRITPSSPCSCGRTSRRDYPPFLAPGSGPSSTISPIPSSARFYGPISPNGAPEIGRAAPEVGQQDPEIGGAPEIRGGRGSANHVSSLRSSSLRSSSLRSFSLRSSSGESGAAKIDERGKNNMHSTPLQQLACGLYYAPLPALTLDAEGRVLDYNLALDVLAGDELNGRRYFPLDGLVQRLAPRVTQGSLFPGANGSALAKCTLNADGLGSVHLTAAETMCHDPATSKAIGRIVSWEVIPANGEDWFHKKYRERLDHQLTWDTYAASYDRVLNLMPYYREVVERHRAALAATVPGPIVDLGAGTGNLAEALMSTGRQVTVVDNSRAMVDKLRSKPILAAKMGKRLTVIRARAEFLPIDADASFVA